MSTANLQGQNHGVYEGCLAIISMGRGACWPSLSGMEYHRVAPASATKLRVETWIVIFLQYLRLVARVVETMHRSIREPRDRRFVAQICRKWVKIVANQILVEAERKKTTPQKYFVLNNPAQLLYPELNGAFTPRFWSAKR